MNNIQSADSLPEQATEYYEASSSAIPRLSKLAQKLTQTPVTNPDDPFYDSPSPKIVPLDVQWKKKDSISLRKSRSTPGLVHQLSHKLSSTFGNSTIVHRHSLQSRPSLSSLCQDPAAIMDTATDIRQGGELTSSASNLSRNVSDRDRFVGKISIESCTVNRGVAQVKERKDTTTIRVSGNSTNEQLPKEKSLSPIPESPVAIQPTILTVETTAIAKIFFETHFNSVLSGLASPRTLRRQELEAMLRHTSLSQKERQQQRRVWAKCESSNLRESRVLKSRSRRRAGTTGVSVAGYEIVRILGKGSFGAVRLVRQDSKSGRNSEGSNDSDASLLNGESRDPRSSVMSTFRSTREGHGRFPVRRNKQLQRQVYAMKVIRKASMLRENRESYLWAERDFLIASEKSKWVVPLIESFQDNDNLYLVMEYMIGGDFCGLLDREQILQEKTARWYVAEMVLCIEETHKLRWIHRDIKPDNFLISCSGHLKICDFGLAFDGHWTHDQGYFNNHRYSLMEKLGVKVDDHSPPREDLNGPDLEVEESTAHARRVRHIGKERHERLLGAETNQREPILEWRNRHGKRKIALSAVGTSQYMAPEVILGEPYDGRCDWWSLGIILFEVLLTVDKIRG